MSYQGIDTSMLMRYDQKGPRYTSYPTAPVWADNFDESEWIAAMQRANGKPDAPLSLYVHIPYCKSMCLYCGCSVIITKNLDKARSYVDIVLDEADLLAAQLPDRRTLHQHHWGGGTPTYLPPEELRRLFLGISERFEHAPDAEISIEVDPSVTTVEQLEVLREVGFNRLSMGIQDFTPEVQETVHRIQSVEETENLIREGRRLGFTSLNVDLIYGLPHQQLDTFAKTLDTVIDWKVDRVACYSFAYVPWLKKHQRALDEGTLPSREMKYELFALALQKFGAADYVAIGLDHFARAEDSLATAVANDRLHRNFMGYTTRMEGGRDGEDMLALGATSIGDIAGTFGQNKKDRRSWQESIESGRLPVDRGHTRTDDDNERRRIILDLMCHFGLDFADYEIEGEPPFTERFKDALAEVAKLVDDGICAIDDTGIRVSEKGRIFLRNLCMPFDAYLAAQRKSGKPMFSRTV